MAATYSWNTNTSSNWSVSGDWTNVNTSSTGTVPTNADTVIINTGTVNVNASTDVANTVSLQGGKLNISTAGDELSVTTLSQTAGQFTLSAGTLAVGSGGVSLNAAAAKNFAVTGGTFTDTGALTVAGSGTFTDNAATTVNGLVTLSDSNSTIGGSNSPAISYGTLTVTANAALSTATLTVSTGAATVNSSQTFTMSGGTLVATTGGIADNGTISGRGKLSGTISGTGAVTASGGALELVSNVTDTSATFNITNSTSSILKLDGSAASSTVFKFASGSTAGVLELGDVTTSAVNFGGTLSNMNVGTATGASVTGVDYINVQSTPITNAVLNGAGTSIELYDGATDLGAIALGTAAAGDFANFGSDTSVTGGNKVGSGTDVWLSTTICFTPGTRIKTPSGEVAVEKIAEGDTVIVLDGDVEQPRQVKWVGYRRLDLVRHPQPNLAAPIRIQRHAFGENQPHRDLIVSPDHGMFVDGKLIPAKLLINDMTIVQERDTRVVEYYHLELDRHAILVAEGLPVESYLDTGNRAFFSNAGLALVLHPEFHVNAGLKCWETDACAPLAVSEAAVKPVWQRLVARAEALGYVHSQPATTVDPDLHLVADGRSIRPLSRDGNRYTFSLPADVASLRLASRATVPSYLAAYVDDWRHLGVAVRRIVVRDNAGVTELPPDHPGLTRGWFRVERDDATMWRWMNGDAVVPMPQTDGPVLVEVHVGMSMTHVVTEEVRIAA